MLSPPPALTFLVLSSATARAHGSRNTTIRFCVCVQPNVKPQPEEDGGESVSSPTIATTGVSNVQVGPFPFLPCLSLYLLHLLSPISFTLCLSLYLWPLSFPHFLYSLPLPVPFASPFPPFPLLFASPFTFCLSLSPFF